MKKGLFIIVMVLGIASSVHATGKEIKRTIDMNKDGTVDRKEYKTQISQTFDRYDTNNDGYLTATELEANTGITNSNKLLKKMDKNKDGKVTREEYNEAARRRFKICDKNDDDCLDKEEFDDPDSLPKIKPFIIFSF
ncbi:MAG: EF-hand domain-containing protein [Deltaproteobacteria bacterium]|nr:EF-hand domain-containing protein [Deltaproteobacteria bacterium]